VSQGRAPLSQTESAKDSGHYLKELARRIAEAQIDLRRVRAHAMNP
jgi:hypothetical protein